MMKPETAESRTVEWLCGGLERAESRTVKWPCGGPEADGKGTAIRLL